MDSLFNLLIMSFPFGPDVVAGLFLEEEGLPLHKKKKKKASRMTMTCNLIQGIM